MMNPPTQLSREQRARLLNILNRLALFAEGGGRDLLLQDLPPALCNSIKRSDIGAIDLVNIIRAAEAWGPLDDDTPALLVVLDNALYVAQGGAAGRDLKRLYDELLPPPPAPAVVAPVALHATDPATLVIAHAAADTAAVGRLARVLRERGVAVVYDTPDTPLLADDGRELLARIAGGCDAVLVYLTEAALGAPLVWRAAVAAARARRRGDPRFRILPVLAGLAEVPTAGEWADLAALAGYHPVVMGAEGDLRAPARRGLRDALAGRIARSRPGESLGLCLHTWPYTPPAAWLHLNLDWSAAFQHGDPAPAVWQDFLFPALADVVEALADQPPGAVVWLKARLFAAIALGYYFVGKGALSAVDWRSDTGLSITMPGARGGDDLLERPADFPDWPGREVVLEVAISRDVTPAVTRWLAGRDLPRLCLEPPGGPSNTALTSPEQARAWAQQIWVRLRHLWDRMSAGTVHLFVACPVEWAALLGQQLYDTEAHPHPIYVYADVREGGIYNYQLAYVLGASGAHPSGGGPPG